MWERVKGVQIGGGRGSVCVEVVVEDVERCC